MAEGLRARASVSRNVAGLPLRSSWHSTFSWVFLIGFGYRYCTGKLHFGARAHARGAFLLRGGFF